MIVIPLKNSRKKLIVDDCDEEFLNCIWFLTPGGYATTNKNCKSYSIHRLILNLKKGDKRHGHHIDHNPLNNQRVNLKICTVTQHRGNARKGAGSSRHKGVCWDKQKNFWMSKIKFKRKSIFLGYFDRQIDAAKQYDKAARILFGEFACLNFPNCRANKQT